MADLHNQVALVTGSGRYPSTGRTIALRLARDGADVIAHGRHRSPDSLTDLEKQMGWLGAESVAEEIRALGRESIAVEGDVASEEDAAAMLEVATSHFGRIDILVNNAADTPLASLMGMDESRWDVCMDTNVIGPFLCAREAARHMAKASRGKIINISSRLAQVGAPTVSAYGASKAALERLTQVMALEWGAFGINVNAVAPGVMTDSGNHRVNNYFPAENDEEHWSIIGDLIASQEDASPIGTLDDPESLAGVVSFLASSDADKLTGQVIALTSGLLM